jgi:hypothetical protein
MEKTITFTEMPLGANQTITTEAANLIDYITFGSVEMIIVTDAAGTLYFEESNDNKTWSASGTFSVDPNDVKRTGALLLRKQFFRFKYVNGNKRQSRIKSIINFIDSTTIDPIFKTIKAAGSGVGNATVNLPQAVTRINFVNLGTDAAIIINDIEVTVPGSVVAFEDDFESFASFSVESSGEWLYTVKS